MSIVIFDSIKSKILHECAHIVLRVLKTCITNSDLYKVLELVSTGN